MADGSAQRGLARAAGAMTQRRPQWKALFGEAGVVRHGRSMLGGGSYHAYGSENG
jgi:hypothetical protein